VPDPYGCGHDSYAAHNNNMLRDFLDRFGFDYEFMASSDCYNDGRFDDVLREVLRRYGRIMDVMLPTLREERRQSYSPVLPISPASGKVLQVPVTVVDADAGTIRFDDPDAGSVEQSIFGGKAKLQWKVDWAARWVALGVDYEMSGKDLIDSVTQSSKIARVLGGRPPEGFNYELFLDENGEKISKTKGNGVTIDEWLTYAPEESLAFYIYREPKTAKQLSFGIIPKAVDEYQRFASAYAGQPIEQKLGNPVHHIHGGPPPFAEFPISFSLLLNLVGAAGSSDPDVVWGFVAQYLASHVEGPTDHLRPGLEAMIAFAIRYFQDFVAPSLRRRPPTAEEAAALRKLDEGLGAAPADASDIQNLVYEVGKEFYGKEGLRDWFRVLYETLLGSSQGPRMGSFIALYGIDPTRKLIAEALASMPK
jgi:lysyl-tRNA synthetase class 1